MNNFNSEIKESLVDCVSEPSEHYFGGDWTGEKLSKLSKYLTEYAKIMAKQNFKFAYIDAFAGTGYVDKLKKNEQDGLLFLDLALDEPQSFLNGSAKIALETKPHFSKYIFIDKDPDHCSELKITCDEHPDQKDSIEIVNQDANAYLQELCTSRNWSKHRAVLFLDPYGMQVEWKTIECIARTKAIDMWLLFPLGMSINRMLKKDGNIPDAWVNKLDTFFGTHDWEKHFYKQEQTPTLFGEETSIVKCGNFETISRYFIDRLKTVFSAVADNPLTLCNSKNNPLFLLCFAAGNEKGGPIAKKIAEYILGK